LGQEASLLLPLETPIHNTVFFPLDNILPLDNLQKKDPFIYFKSVIMGVSTVTLFPISPDPIPMTVLPNLDRICQRQVNWCWAACTAMVVKRYMLGDPQPCDVVSSFVDRIAKSCCTQPGSAICSPGCPVDKIEEVYKIWHLRATMSTLPGTLTPAQVDALLLTIQNEILAGRPVELRYLMNSGTASHVIIIAGFGNNGTGLRFKIADPADSIGTIAAEALPTLNGKGNWTTSWTGIAPLQN